MKLYRERGVNPASGCLPAALQLVLLLPMYQVFSQGLSAPDISSMLSVFGVTVVDIQCQTPANPIDPCINPDIPWLAWIPKIVDGQPSCSPATRAACRPTCRRSSGTSCRACSACRCSRSRRPSSSSSRRG